MASSHSENDTPTLASVLQQFEGIDPNYVDLDERQAAACLGQRPKTLESWRREGRGPSFMKLGRHVRYRLSAILDYRDKCTFRSSRQAMTRDERGSERRSRAVA